MKFITEAFLFLASCALASAEQDTSAPPRTSVSVQYEYQLEVDDVQKAGSTDDVLMTIDNDIIGHLQNTLPNGEWPVTGGPPNVRFISIESEIFSACFTTSEQCSLVRSEILIRHDGEKPDNSIEFTTLSLVQDYLNGFTNTNEDVVLSYAYPMMVSTLTQFRMNTVADRMTETEIDILESTFKEVFGAIVFAIEGDTDVVDARFLYQDLFQFENTDTFTLATDMIISGFCRDCTSDQFGAIMNEVIIDNLGAYQSKLMVNGNGADSDYFDNVKSVTFAVPELPSALPPIEDDSIYDDEAPNVKSKHPWFLYFGIVMVILIILIGVGVIVKDHRDLEKDGAFNTSSSSEEEEGSYLSDSIEENIEANETLGEGEEYQVETIAPTDDGDVSNYEVYVF